jgi:outer membrane protein assembly factor BamB
MDTQPAGGTATNSATVDTSPAVTGETVISPFSSGELIALRTSNGQQLWQQVLSRTNRTNALSEIRDIVGRPVVSRGEQVGNYEPEPAPV